MMWFWRCNACGAGDHHDYRSFTKLLEQLGRPKELLRPAAEENLQITSQNRHVSFAPDENIVNQVAYQVTQVCCC